MSVNNSNAVVLASVFGLLFFHIESEVMNSVWHLLFSLYSYLQLQ